MFDFRYHALSLAAVLIALTVGLLLGVAIGDANLVSNAEKRVVSSLMVNLNQARGDTSAARAQLTFRTSFERAIYPQLVGGALNRKRIGVIFLGQASDQVSGLVHTALDPSGAQVVLVVGIHDPINAAALGAAAPGTRYSAMASDPTLIAPFGTRVGVELVRGGRLITMVQPALFSSYNGTIERLDGVILVRAPGRVDPAAQRINDQFENGLAAGLAKTGVAVVGVETSSTVPSQVSWFTQRNFSSVDDLEDIAGSTALVEALSGAHGVFGRKSTATAVLPPVAGNGP